MKPKRWHEYSYQSASPLGLKIKSNHIHCVAHQNNWTLCVPRSATKIWPLPETQSPVGLLKSAWSVVPGIPNFLINFPLRVNNCTLTFLKSATAICPSESTAMPEGHMNCPSPIPLLPILEMNFPESSYICTRKLFVSETTMLLSAVTVMCLGEFSFPSALPYPPNWEM